LGDLTHMAPKINWDDLSQTAALPLGSWLKTDPWDDKVHMLNAKRYAPMNARDKMPFEVTPIFYKLQRYDAAAVTPPAAAAPASGDQPVAAPDNTPPAQPQNGAAPQPEQLTPPPQNGATPQPDQQPTPPPQSGAAPQSGQQPPQPDQQPTAAQNPQS